MIPYWQLNGSKLYQGHVLDVLKSMPPSSVQCIVTSPPYWGLRDYGLPPVEWPAVSYAPMAGLPAVEVPGCDPECEHVWGEKQVKRAGRDPISTARTSTLGIPKDGTNPRKCTETNQQYQVQAEDISGGQLCQLCGSWRGSLGLEPTIEAFVGHLVLVWRELWQVLRDDGTCWLNLGDSYVSGPAGSRKESDISGRNTIAEGNGRPSKFVGSLKPKNLISVPWRVAFALQADGWYLRSDIIWAKGVSFCSTYSGSCMPESVRDRPTKGHEYVFLLSKSKRYYYDGDAVRENHTEIDRRTAQGLARIPYDGKGNPEMRQFSGDASWLGQSSAGRNLRSVWLINPGSYAGAHFATFPPALVEPMIKAGTSERGCCPECGAPWERVTSKGLTAHNGNTESAYPEKTTANRLALLRQSAREQGQEYTNKITTTGWRPTCTCSTYPQNTSYGGPNDVGELEGVPFEPVPCTVLDPFTGSGTTLEAAIKLRRRGVGIELSKEYCDNHIIPRLEKPLQMELAL